MLLVVGVLTAGLLSGTIPIVAHRSGGANIGPDTTPTPSNLVIVPVDPRSRVQGSIVYVKDGNLWVQTGAIATQVTSTGRDSMPSYSPDGQSIYYVETRQGHGFYPCGGGPAEYTEQVPSLLRLRTNGGATEQLATGGFTSGSYSWFSWLRQPVASPDGRRLALVSDAPDPCVDDVVVQFLNLSTRRLTAARLPETPPLGQQDPAWSPDGRSLLYVRNGREGAIGTPVVYRFDLSTRANVALTGPGYLQPSWSPDGRDIAVTHLGSSGSDIVVLSASSGNELLRVTTDGRSSAPIWSPNGDAIAYLSTSSAVTDLDLVSIAGTAPQWTIGTPIALTELAGLDPGSRPSWFIPADQLGPTSTGSATASP
ncbi:MAG TPA: hypothetical protein VE011_07245 [Candidatus Dormibacteraeota bacterium]|nr:hypothetical protein [Candidatus Dormibacteraeota bacterium]